jgi:ribonuclease D
VREELARGADKPPSFILPDLAALQMARQQPKSIGDLRAVRGVPGLPEQQAKRFLSAIQTALDSDPGTWPSAIPVNVPTRVWNLSWRFWAWWRAPARRRRTFPEIISRRAMHFSIWRTGGSKGQQTAIQMRNCYLSDWRGEILGRDLVKLLDGDAVIALDKESGLPELRAN